MLKCCHPSALADLTKSSSWWGAHPTNCHVQRRTIITPAELPTRNNGVSEQAKSARFAVSLFFFTNGVIYASLVPHYPTFKADLGLSNATYGIAIASFAIGGLVAGAFAAKVLRALGSARIAFLFTVISSAVLVLVPHTNHLFTFMAALIAIGGLDALSDLGENTHGIRVEHLYGRSILNSFHGIWSIGAVTGGAAATITLALNISPSVHLAATGVVTALCAWVAYRKSLPGPDITTAEEGDFTRPTLSAKARTLPFWFVLGGLVVLALATNFTEDIGSTWSTLYLRNDLAASAALAPLGYVGLVLAQFIGRMLGDSMVDRFGERAVATVGSGLIFAAMTFALAFPTIPGTMAALAIAGFGSATLIPAATKAANQIPGLKPGTGLAICNWFMRFTMLVTPPLVGVIADHTSLRVGMTVLPALAFLALLSSQLLASDKHVPTK